MSIIRSLRNPRLTRSEPTYTAPTNEDIFSTYKPAHIRLWDWGGDWGGDWGVYWCTVAVAAGPAVATVSHARSTQYRNNLQPRCAIIPKKVRKALAVLVLVDGLGEDDEDG